MPEIIVYAVAGRSAEAKRGLFADITQALVKNFNVPAEAVTIQIIEAQPDSKAKGGKPFSDNK